jgi:uncharacterized protein (DUF1800 family)
MPAAAVPATRQAARRRLRDIAESEARAALTTRVTSDRPFVERLVAFWSNHLCVSMAANVLVVPFAGSYEREVIAPHVLGRFEDMVLASAHHPAMLIYLDNFRSIGPNSRAAQSAAQRGGQQRGLNENYARELLELHTLGVDGGYAQQDVRELAKVLTGWTVDGIAGPGRARGGMGRGRRTPVAPSSMPEPIAFIFETLRHEPGAKRVLGVTYSSGDSADGARVIRALCRHASTARFVATKLVRHFISDEPPAAAVERVARVFRDSDGDLRAVSTTLIDLPELWSPNARKFRTPQDWLVAVLRAVDGGSEMVAAAMPWLRQLRQPLWSPPAPNGYGDLTAQWADSDALLNRAELARTIARRVPATVDPRALGDVVDIGPGDPLQHLLADASIRAQDRVALALAGPAFQWR